MNPKFAKRWKRKLMKAPMRGLLKLESEAEAEVQRGLDNLGCYNSDDADDVAMEAEGLAADADRLGFIREVIEEREELERERKEERKRGLR